ncbi:MAG: DUF5348 domain-containing protein [Coprobacillaceae bacterium]
MIKPNDVVRELKGISHSINKIAKEVGYLEYGELCDLDIDRTLPEDIFYKREIDVILDALGDIQGKIDYLYLPIKYEGELFRNVDGRYETERGDYYTSGSVIEYMSNDERQEDYPFWRKSRVEHNGVDYCIVGEPDLNMYGLKVRVRRFE